MKYSIRAALRPGLCCCSFCLGCFGGGPAWLTPVTDLGYTVHWICHTNMSYQDSLSRSRRSRVFRRKKKKQTARHRISSLENHANVLNRLPNAPAHPSSSMRTMSHSWANQNRFQSIDHERPRRGICISIVTYNTCDYYCIARCRHWQSAAAF